MVQVERPTLTFAEIVERLQNRSDLPAWKRGELISAVRSFVRRFEPEGMSATARPDAINAVLLKATPAMARLAESSFSNMVSRLRAALHLCGIISQPGRHTNGLLEPWRSLFEPIKHHSQRSRLSRFFHTASRHGWKPEDITVTHFQLFYEELKNGAILKDGERVAREAAKLWNNFAEQMGWTPVDFKLPRKRFEYTFAWDKYPASLEAEVRALLDRLGNADILSGDDRPPLRPKTLINMEFQLKMFAAALVHRGRDPASLKSLRDLYRDGAYVEGLRFFLDRAGGKVTLQVRGIAEHVYRIAKRDPEFPADELASMTKLVKRLKQQLPQIGLTEKNQRKLAQFDSLRNRDGILLLPRKLHYMAKAGRNSARRDRAAGLMITAVAIEMLLMCPIRISNLAALDLKRHIRRQHSGRYTTTHIYIPANETKNSVEIHFELPRDAARMLDEYIDEFRPDLPGAAASSILFPGRSGNFRAPKQFWSMISKAGRRYLGVDINPHLFRHLAAKLYLDEHPGGYEVVRRTLGHTSMDTTARSYAGQETGRSIRHYDRTILKLRDEALRKPARAARSARR